MNTVYVHFKAWQAMVQHSRAQAPNEACGVVLGRGDYVPITNRSVRPETSFSFDPQEWMKQVNDNGGDLDGMIIFHSHPLGSARPSPNDQQWFRVLHLSPGQQFLIYSVEHEVMRGFTLGPDKRWIDGRVEATG